MIMRPPLALPIVLLILLAAPVSAVFDLQTIGYNLTEMQQFTATESNLDFNAYSDGNLIAQLQIGVYPGTNCQILLYDSGQTIPSWINISDDLTISASLENQTIPSWGTSILSYPLGTDADHIRHRFVYRPMTSSIYAENPNSTDLYLQLVPQNAGDRKVSVPLINSIYRVQIISNKPVEVTAWIAPESEIYDQTNKKQENTAGFLSLVKQTVKGVYDIASIIWVVFKTVVIENFTLTVAIYEAAVMAYSFNKARDIFQAFKLLIRYNKAFLEFMVWLLESIVSIATKAVTTVLLKL